MLSLGQGDFVKALKEILGLRHQDRLMYLRSHPLFVSASLEDLDQASDLLSLSFFTPGSVMYPDPSGEGRTYLIAEGECSVRRRKGKGQREQERNRLTSTYDDDTISILGSLEIFGLDPSGQTSLYMNHKDPGASLSRPSTAHAPPPPSQPAFAVEAMSQVKAYYISREHYSQLPVSIQEIVHQACNFKSSFIAGRLQSRATHNPSRAISSTSYSHPQLQSDARLTASDTSMASSPPLAQSASKAQGSKLSPILYRLATNQVADLFKAEALKSSMTAAGFCSQDLTAAEARERKGSPKIGRRKEEPTLQLAVEEPVDRPPQASRARLISAPLSLLPPSETTWSRLPMAKHKTVVTEKPREAMAPSALASRHAAVFASSQRALHNKQNSGRGSLLSQGFKNSSLKGAGVYSLFDEEDEIHEAWRRTSGAGGPREHSVDRNLRVVLAQQQAHSSFHGSGDQSMNQTMKKGSSEILRLGVDDVDDPSSSSIAQSLVESPKSGAKPSTCREEARSKSSGRRSQGRSTPPPSQPSPKNSLLNDTVAPNARPHRPRNQGPPSDDGMADQPSQQDQSPSYCLPASVVLGYESLNPFQWAHLQSYYGKGAGDSVLPRPKW